MTLKFNVLSRLPQKSIRKYLKQLISVFYIRRDGQLVTMESRNYGLLLFSVFLNSSFQYIKVAYNETFHGKYCFQKS